MPNSSTLLRSLLFSLALGGCPPSEPPTPVKVLQAAPPAPCGSPAECTTKAKTLLAEVSTAANDALIFELLSHACAGDEPEGCALLGLGYKYGRGTPKDETRAFTLYEKSCSLGHAPGCFNVGLMAKVGLGTRQSWGVAERNYQKSCEGGFGMACRELALARQRGEGLEKDLALAAHYFRAACETKDLLAGESSCEELRLMCKTLEAPACSAADGGR